MATNHSSGLRLRLLARGVGLVLLGVGLPVTFYLSVIDPRPLLPLFAVFGPLGIVFVLVPLLATMLAGVLLGFAGLLQLYGWVREGVLA